MNDGECGIVGPGRPVLPKESALAETLERIQRQVPGLDPALMKGGALAETLERIQRQFGQFPGLSDRIALGPYAGLSAAVKAALGPVPTGLSSQVRLPSGLGTAIAEAQRATTRILAILPAMEWLQAAQRLSPGISIQWLPEVSARIAIGTSQLRTRPPSSLIMRHAVTDGLVAWGTLVDNAAPQPAPADVERLTLAGDSTLSIVESVSQCSLDVDLVAAPDVMPGCTGLRACLEGLSPTVVARWEGARERVEHPGPDAASQAAHSLVELIDWTLRLAAPDSEVLAWHAVTARPPQELSDGKATRALRAKFLVRGRPGEAEAAEIFARALVDIMRVLQKKKHAQGDNERLAVARLIPGVEAFLYFLLS